MKAMLEVDDHHWWYRGRRRIIRTELDRLPLPAGARVLDAGCGSGRTLEELAPYGEVRGIELDPGRRRARPRPRGRGEVQIGRLEELPWEDGTFDLITCLDVIEHTPDDRVDAARAAARVQAGRLPAGDRARLPGAVVDARRGQPPLPPLLARHAARRRRRDAGWRVVRHDLVQQRCCWRRPPRCGSPSAAGCASRTRTTRPS